MEPIDISHIHEEYPHLSKKIPWVLAIVSEFESYLPGDEQVYVYLDPKTIFFQPDSKRKSPQNSNPEIRRREARGQLDPSIKALLCDLHFIPDVDGFLPKGLVLVSARYPWTSYLHDIRTPLLQKLFYDLPIAPCGETIGDRLQIKADLQPRALIIISGVETTGPVRMGGSSSDILIRKGMGVLFQDFQALSPKCALLQGLVVNIDDDPNAIKVRLDVGPPLRARNLKSRRGLGRIESKTNGASGNSSARALPATAGLRARRPAAGSGGAVEGPVAESAAAEATLPPAPRLAPASPGPVECFAASQRAVVAGWHTGGRMRD